MRRKHRRVQPKLAGGAVRTPLPSCIEDRIWAEVDYQAKQFGCSRSWVVATILADYFDLHLDHQYRYDAKEKK